ncbi:hypothetical protein PACTADRAFT_40950 [Pachysolen tannophilus NRRL Y-2460]|uniref:PPM-type phosphatase domain-containing protein n=1 Tax=Pachysolen tannophilus NRRL Y-2460 TaxID=669874 RepID=A0A1E4TVY9_PACTA|nr:hypothetical protein PACTADRAFT_40950 [Pachysolen tannophilus NRRL Y-2460]
MAHLIFKKHISQYLSVPIKNSRYRYRVDLMKVPSNYGYYSSRVNRLYNEDNFSSAVLDHITKVFNFNVFDGHGGDNCAIYLKENLSKNIENYIISQENIDKLFKSYVKDIGGYWRRWYKKKDEKLNEIVNAIENWQKEEINGENLFKLKIYMSFLETDYNFLLKDYNSKNHSGSTCTSCFLYTIDPDITNGGDESFFYEPNTLSKLIVAHCGDTRAILCDNQGLAHGLTVDHHPNNPVENRRLTKYASNFLMTDSFGEERFVNFANTRSFGDINGKDKGISAEPEFFEFIIGDTIKLQKYLKITNEQQKNSKILKNLKNFGGDECFLVLVSDGVTNCISDQEVVDIIMATSNNKGLSKGTPQEAAKQVVKFVECVGGDDNATCNVIKLSGWGKWPLVDRTGKLRESKMMDDLKRLKN